MPLQATSGAASYDAFGGGAVAEPNYIESCFSSWLYTGNGSAQTINNGIDLAGKGGLTWFKRRNASGSHYLFDTARGNNFALSTNETFGQGGGYSAAFNFASTGFTLAGDEGFNTSAATYASWTFREQPKFFDVVTYTGNGVAGRTVAHNLGSVPGCIIVKRTDGAAFWGVYHRGVNGGTNPQQYYLKLDGTDAQIGPNSALWNSTSPTSTEFTLGTASGVNFDGGQYVAYLFAHNAGGFGLTGTDNVISCGSWTANTDVNLGYEPQWILYRNAATLDNWKIVDNMRGFSNTDGTFTAQAVLNPNTSGAEGTASGVFPTATGFTTGLGSGTFIYIAIRRGPMRTPTTGTSVFTPIARTGTGSAATVTGVGFPTDLVLHRARSNVLVTPANMWQDRLRGIQRYLKSNNTNQEFSDTSGILTLTMDGMTVGVDADENNVNISGVDYINYFMRRAPGFFDEVCYTGTGTNQSQKHNLQAIPELIIAKSRSASQDWGGLRKQIDGTYVFGLSVNSSAALQYGSGSGFTAGDLGLSTTTFDPQYFENSSGSAQANTAGTTYVAYLFASCPGVSKVGSYTGTGTTQTINCGFTGGARFVMIKRTDSTGDWYVWDTARGMIPANDPYLLLNSAAAEVTGTDFVDTAATGFEITSTAPAAINANGGTFIFLAIA